MNNKEVMLLQRRMIGAFGFLLPFALLIIVGIRPTISQTYHTHAQDIFTTTIVTVGIILMTYRGYKAFDYFMTNIAGFFAVALSLIPCAFQTGERYGFLQLPSQVSGIIHTTSAALFFVTLAYICAFLFTKGDSGTKEKAQRNIVYKTCAIIMLVVEIMMLTISIFKLDVGNMFYWLESIALWAFSIAFLVKGETILKDKE